MLDVVKSDRCAICDHTFAEHEWVLAVPEDQYICPITKSEVFYGNFKGGDPRRFDPDEDRCVLVELDLHYAACKAWNEAERRGETPDPEPKPKYHFESPYGTGYYTHVYKTEWKPKETPDQEQGNAECRQ